MEVLLIYNPVSSNGIFQTYLDHVIDQFQKHGMQIIPYRMDTYEALDARMASLNADTYKKILIAGGDGTIHQVVNLMRKYAIDLPISLFPVGTANDFAQYFNIPKTIEGMTDIAVRDNYTYCDIGKMNEQYFVNVASLGFLIDISQKTDRRFKNNLGVLAYYLKGLEELPNLKPINVKIDSETQQFEGDIYFMLIMNGKSAGGFRKIAPYASLSDGLFDIFVFKKCPVIEIMPLMLKIVNGEHIDHPHVLYFQTNSLAIECDQPVGTDLDGEKGSDFPLQLQVIHKGLRVNTLLNNQDGFPMDRSLRFADVKKTFDDASKGFFDEIKRPLVELASERNTTRDIAALIRSIPKHDSFNYVNRRTIGDSYFEEAEKSLENGYMYLVLSSTGSPAGQLIQRMTKKAYSHVSLSFDEELKTIISYNGGENLYSPGLNHEMIEFFNQKEDANIMVYKIPASRAQKATILEEIRKIDEQGSSYNVLGLFLSYSHRDNIMFCSQFVYSMLKVAGLSYFDKKPEHVRPMDFIELDYERCLEYCTRLFLNE